MGRKSNRDMRKILGFAAAAVIFVAGAVYHLIGDAHTPEISNSVLVDPSRVDAYRNDDYLFIHEGDLADIDFDALIGYQEAAAELPDTADLDSISYRILNGNEPYFSPGLLSAGEFELYSDLDYLGRCGMAFANISEKTMPLESESRGDISSVRPSGWHSVKLDGIDNGGYLYNRCHLIGYQLGAENANEKNLITGTRHLNIQGMLGFENAIASYVRETGNHVLYAVTPVYKNQELVARGVLLEAYSIEDGGKLSFCAFCYNNQPGVKIDYATGEVVD